MAKSLKQSQNDNKTPENDIKTVENDRKTDEKWCQKLMKKMSKLLDVVVKPPNRCQNTKIMLKTAENYDKIVKKNRKLPKKNCKTAKRIFLLKFYES